MNFKHYTSVSNWEMFVDPLPFLLKARKEAEEKADEGTPEGLRDFIVDKYNRTFSVKELGNLDKNILDFLVAIARTGKINILKAKKEDDRHVQRYYLYF